MRFYLKRVFLVKQTCFDYGSRQETRLYQYPVFVHQEPKGIVALAARCSQ